jgi:predicted nucleic acid-binding protein
MTPYFDTGVLVKAYVPEANSSDADALIRRMTPPIPLTHLHELEIRNALRLKRNRKEITEPELKAALKHLQSDIDSGFFERPIYHLPDVFREAEALSAKYSVTTGARSLDILHVAAALAIGAQEFVSFDKRQRAMASKAGLQVLP